MEEIVETKEEKVEINDEANEKEIKKKKRKEKIKKKGSSFFADFKKFISKGNILDLAVAVVIGTAFNKIVTSLVNDIIMPLISLCTGGVSVEDWKWVITPATETTAEVALAYGTFIQAIIDFLIIALTIFIILRIIVNSQRGIQKLSKKMKRELKKQGIEEEAIVAPQPTVKIESQEDILKDIRSLLTNMSNSQTDNNKQSSENPTSQNEAIKENNLTTETNKNANSSEKVETNKK